MKSLIFFALCLATWLPLPAQAAPAPEKVLATEPLLMDAKSYSTDKGRPTPDKNARTGWAMKADPANKPGNGYVWYGYTYTQQPGKLRVVYRIKVADNTSPEPLFYVVADVANNDLKVPGAGQVLLHVKGTDFKAPNVYQDFPVEVLKGEQGFGQWGVFTNGITALWFDGLDVQQITRFTAPELLAMLKPPPMPADLKLDTTTLRVHETAGLFASWWRTEKAVALLPQAEYSKSTLKLSQQANTLTGYPAKWEELYRYRAIVVDNVPARSVTLTGTMLLKQWVEDGGTLILMGDTHGLEQGQWQDTALGPILPVSLGKARDIVYAGKPLPLQPHGGAFKNLAWDKKPFTLYYHRATVRPGAKVLVASGNIPLIVESRAGKGRIVVLLASVLGKPGAGTPFWNWSDWPNLLAQLLALEAN